MARFDLTDFEWSVIAPLLPDKVRGGEAGRRPTCAERHLLAAAYGGSMGGYLGPLRPAYDLREPLQPLAQSRCVGSHPASGFKGLRWQAADDRLVLDPSASARRQWSKKATRSRSMGRSRGGLTTKIHLLVDACGLPIVLKITEGQAHDGRSSAAATSCWPTAPMTPTPCGLTSLNAARAPMSNSCPTGSTCHPSTNGSTASAISSNASSMNSSIFAPSQPDTTSATTTTSPPSNLHQPEFGCDLMSR
jgi:hypothetical protein